MGNRIKLPRFTCVILLLPVLCYCKDTSVLCQDNGDMLFLNDGNITELANCLNGTELQCENVNNQSTVNITIQTSKVRTFNFSEGLSCSSSSEYNTSCYKCSLISSSELPSNSECDIWSSFVNDSVAYIIVQDTDNTCFDRSLVDQSYYTSTVVDQSTFTNSIGDQSTFTSSLIDQSSFTSLIVDQSTFTSSIVDQSTFTSSIVDQSTFTSSIVDQSTFTSSIVDQSTFTSAVNDQSTFPSALIDQSTFLSALIDQSTFTSSLIDQSIFTRSIFDQSTFTSSLVDVSTFTSSLIDQSTFTSSIVDQPTYPFSSVDTTYLSASQVLADVVSDFDSTESLLEGLQSSEFSGLPSSTLDSAISTVQDSSTAAERSLTSIIVDSASEIASDLLGQSEITKASSLTETSTRTTLGSSYDDSQTTLLSTGLVFKSTPVLHDSFTTTLSSFPESTFTVQPSIETGATFDLSSIITLHNSLEFTSTTLSTAEIYKTLSILNHESELATAAINGSIFLSLAQSMEKTSELSTHAYTEMTENKTLLMSRTSGLFSDSSSVTAAISSEIITSTSPTNIDVSSETFNYQVTSSIAYTTLTTSELEMGNTFSSSDAVTQLHDVTSTASANVTSDATTHGSAWENSTAPAIISSSAYTARPLVSIVLGVVLGTAAAVVLVVLLCLYVRRRKRTQLESRAQRYRSNGYRNWKGLKSIEAKEKKKSLTSEEHVTLSELVTTGKSNETFIRNSFDSFQGLDLPGDKFISDCGQPQYKTSSGVDNPYAEGTLSLTPRQDKTASKALVGGVDEGLDVSTIISGLNNNIQHKNNNNARKSNVLNLEDTKRNNQELAGQNTEIARRNLIKVDEIKQKAELRMASAMYSIYSEVKNGDVNKESVAVRPSSSGVYTTIDEMDAKRNVSRMDSLYDEVEETGKPPKRNYYSSVRKDDRDKNDRTVSSDSSLYGISRISDASVSGISQRADSTRNSHLYEYVSYTCGKDLGSTGDSEQNSVYSSAGHSLRETLNLYNSIPEINNITSPGESLSEHKHLKPLPKAPPGFQISDIESRPMETAQRESGLSETGENIYFILEKDDV